MTGNQYPLISQCSHPWVQIQLKYLLTNQIRFFFLLLHTTMEHVIARVTVRRNR